MVATPAEWVLLAYRLPREPSTPRIAVWRRLQRVGAAQLLDGLVGLPMGARSKEELEWVAEQVEEAGGEATLWVGRPSSRADEARIVRSLRAAMAERYRGFLREVEEVGHLDGADRRRGVERLRRELRRLAQRDHFPPPEAARARRELERLAERTGART